MLGPLAPSPPLVDGACLSPQDRVGTPLSRLPEAVRRSQPPILESTALNHFVSPGRGALSSHLGSPSTIPGADSSFASQTTPDSDAALEGTVFR